jgi:hypothetical protein
MGAYSHLQDPENEYLLITSHKGWSVLQLIWNTPQSDLMNRWKESVALYRQAAQLWRRKNWLLQFGNYYYVKSQTFS